MTYTHTRFEWSTYHGFSLH